MAGEPGPQLRLIATLEGGRPKLLSNVVFSPDGKLLASSDYNIDDRNRTHSIKLWDVPKRKVVATLPGGSFADLSSSCAFSPDGKTLAAGGREKGDDEKVTLKLWDVATGKAKASPRADDVNAVAFSPDGKTLASAGRNAGKTGMTSGRADNLGVLLWDLATLKEMGALKGHAGPVFSVAFSPDGKLVASGCGEFASNGQAGSGEVKVWDAATGRELALMGGVKLAGKLLPSLREGASGRKLEVPETVWKKLGALKNKEYRTKDDFERELSKILGKSLDKDKRDDDPTLRLWEWIPAKKADR
jgi:WD40 repeat protein